MRKGSQVSTTKNPNFEREQKRERKEMDKRLADVYTCIERKVNVIGVILEYGFPKRTRGTDWCCNLRIIDETHHKIGMTVNIFAENAERLPLVAAVGDVILLRKVLVKQYVEDVNIVFNKKFSTFALYKGQDSDDFVPYQVFSQLILRYEEKMYLNKLRKWLINFQLQEDSNEFPMLREIKEVTQINLVCKILKCYEAATDKLFIFAWDGTDTPPNAICSKLENEVNSPLLLQIEPLPLPREILLSLPTIGSILKITCNLSDYKNYLHLFNVGKWVKFMNIHLEVHDGLWCGAFTAFTKFRYTPNEDSLIIERQRLFDERISSCSFPKPSCITEVKHARKIPDTLMSVLTHSEIPAKFRCVVRVVAAMPCQAEYLCSSDGVYRMQLTLEDSTARIHAFVMAEDGETLFDGYPGIEEVTKKLNKLLGVAVCDGEKDTPRNPPWVTVCLQSFNVSENDVHFKIFDTKIVGEA